MIKKLGLNQRIQQIKKGEKILIFIDFLQLNHNALTCMDK